MMALIPSPEATRAENLGVIPMSGGYVAQPGEPAVVSTVTGKQNFATKVQPKVDQANQVVTAANAIKGTTLAQDQAKAANQGKPGYDVFGNPVGDVLPPEVQAEMDASKTPEQKLDEQRLADFDKQQGDAEERANNLTLAATQSAQAEIASMTGQWQERRALIQQANKANEANWLQQFTRTGQAEYSPGMTGDMISQKEDEGLRKVKAADDEYNSKVAEINAALQAKKFDIVAQKTQELDAIKEKAYNLMKDNAKEARTINDKLRENTIQASRDQSIANLVSQGVTDPTKIIDYLNKYEDGSSTGGDFTAEEISKALKAFTVDEKDPKNITTDLKTFEYIRDTYGLPDDISSLPPEQQYFAYLKTLKQANSAPKTPSPGGYSALELRKLRQKGIDPTDTAAADDFLYGNEDSDTVTGVPTWEEYLDAAEKVANMSLGPNARTKLKQQYDDEFGQYTGDNKAKPFSDTELKKLEQGGLLNAPRQKQLDFLYKKKDDSSDEDVPDVLK